MKLSPVILLISLLIHCLVALISAQEEDTMSLSSILVVGATGATGRHVVSQLLDKNHKVSVIVRSKERMLNTIGDHRNKDMLSITETPSLQIADLPDSLLQEHMKNADVIISCLGHNLDFKGIWGHPRRLVTDTVRRLTSGSGAKGKKFILMGSDGVAHPNDNPRVWYERFLLSILRNVIPPHADNEEAAAYLLDHPRDDDLEWVVVRPTDLIDTDAPTRYTLYDKPPGSLFGGGEASRSTVAKFMADLVHDKSLWEQYKYKMPVVHNTKMEGKDEL